MKKEMSLFKIPDDVWRMVVEFATCSLWQVLVLQRVGRHFRQIMRHPLMVSHLRVELGDLSHVQRLGSFRLGVHDLTAEAVPARAAVFGVRTGCAPSEPVPRAV